MGPTLGSTSAFAYIAGTAADVPATGWQEVCSGAWSASHLEIEDGCTSCPASKYSPLAAAACSDCEAGKYTAAVEATVCTSCEAGKYKAAPGRLLKIQSSSCVHAYIYERQWFAFAQQYDGKPAYTSSDGTLLIYYLEEYESWCISSSLGSISLYAMSWSTAADAPASGWQESCDETGWADSSLVIEDVGCISCPAGKYKAAEGRAFQIRGQACQADRDASLVDLPFTLSGQMSGKPAYTSPDRKKWVFFDGGQWLMLIDPPSPRWRFMAARIQSTADDVPLSGWQESCYGVWTASNLVIEYDCVECAEGKYSKEEGRTACDDCSTLTNILSCQECRPNGGTPLRDGWCLAQEKCYEALTPFSADYLPDPMDALFASSTENDGCQFCSSDSPAMLAKVADNTLCPGKRCFEDQEFVCLEGQCNRARSCKECYECRDQFKGCEPMEHHCDLPEGGCGCLIDNTCYPHESPMPGNSCLESSLYGESIMRQKCTGSWVPVTDLTVERVQHCAGETACRKNQLCEAGECKSDPYDLPPDPCIASYTCTPPAKPGKGNNDFYNYEFLTPEMLPKQCHFPNTGSTCELPSYCIVESTKCPDLAFLVPLFNESANSVLEYTSAKDGFIGSLPIVFAMPHPPEIRFDNGQIDPYCSTAPNIFSQHSSPDNAAACPAGQYRQLRQDGANAESTCVSCETGKYKALSGNMACDMCPANSNSPAGSVSATACTCNAGSSGPDEAQTWTHPSLSASHAGIMVSTGDENKWCGMSNNDDYTVSSGDSLNDEWQLDPGIGWRFCQVTAEECKTYCVAMGIDDCVEFYMVNVYEATGRGCCFPSKRPLVGQSASSSHCPADSCSHGCGGAYRAHIGGGQCTACVAGKYSTRPLHSFQGYLQVCAGLSWAGDNVAVAVQTDGSCTKYCSGQGSKCVASSDNLEGAIDK